MQELYKQLKECGHVRLNEPLAKHSTFKIGGPADFFIEVLEVDKFTKLLSFLNSEGVEYFVLGGGSNILFPDERFEGVIIKLKNAECRMQNDDTIVASAGVLFSQVVSLAAQNSLSGLEWASGIPGTVGGAVRGNAGAMGKENANCVDKVEVWRPPYGEACDGEILVLPAAECEFKYRESVFKHNHDIILRVWYKLRPGEKKEIMMEMNKYLEQRNGHYPAWPNAGSFFKNIPLEDWPGDTGGLPEKFIERKKVPAGWLIEELNLKGLAVGGAKVSDEHGNFIVNFNHATQQDILTLMEQVKEKVYNKFGVELVPEVEIVV